MIENNQVAKNSISTQNNDRNLWLKILCKIAKPVLINGANGTYGGMINIAQSNGNINLYSQTALTNVNIGFTATYYQA